MANETTTKFKVDISELRKGIQEANRQIKLANAEFKAASSGMDNWQNSTDGLQAKITSLGTKLTAQKTILASYEKQLELIVKEEGENSKGTDEMRIKIANQKAEINNTEKELKKYQTRLTEVESEQKKETEAIEKQKTAYEKLQDEIEDQERELEELKKEYANVALEQGKNSDSAKELGAKIDQLSTDLKENKDKLKDVEGATDDLDHTFEDTTKGGLDAFAVAVGNLASNVISAAIDKMKEFIKSTIDLGANFDTSMSKVEAVSGATAEEMQQLRDKAKEMGATTKFTATEASEAFNYMAMAGWKTEDMMEGIEGIMSLAAASGADLATTSDIVTDALTAFGYSAKDAGRFADVMAAAASNANTNVEMMGASFKYVAPVAGAMGYSIEDVAVALGLMANSGIKADAAGSSLRNLLQRLAKPTDEVAAAMDIIGVSLADDEGNMYSLMDVMNQMRDGFGNIKMSTEDFTRQCEELDSQLEDGSITQKEYDKQLEELTNRAFGAEGAEKARAAAMLGGARAMAGLLAISNATTEDFDKLTGAINDSEGAAKDMADTMLNNLGGDMTLLESKLDSVKLELYERFQPALRKGVKALDKLLDGFKWLMKNGPKVAAVISGVTTAIGAFLIVTKKAAIISAFTKAVTGAKAAIVALNLAIEANPIGILIAILAGLVAAFITLWNTSEDFRQFWIDMWDAVKVSFHNAGEALKKGWQELTEFIDEQIDLITGFWSDFGDAVKQDAEDAVDSVKKAFGKIPDWFSEQIDKITSYWSGWKDDIKKNASDAWDGVRETFEKVPEWFEDKFSSAWKNVKDVFSAGGEVFDGIKEGIASTFTTIVNGLIKGTNEVVSVPFNAINDALNSIRNVGVAGVHPFKGLWDKNPIYVPQIPYLERGGILKKGQIGLLEGSGAEAVVPLDKNKRWISALVKEMNRMDGGVAVGKSVTNNYTFNQTNTSPKALSRLDIYRQTRNQLNFAKGVRT